MKTMKNIFEIFKMDWKRIFKSPVATLLFLALLILPSLYCWFNVWALWDPYSNTSDMKVAVYSADSGAVFGDKNIQVGQELTAQLKKNDSLDWTFVSSKEKVVEGVKSGEYYAGIYVPKTFSKQLLSFVDGQIKKPKLEYFVNTKINAVAPKITDKGAGTLQDTISGEFVTTVGKTLVGVFNDLGVDLDHNLPMLRRFASLITTTDQNLPTIEKYLEEVQTVNDKLPELDQKLQETNKLMAFIPEVNKFSDKLVNSQKYLPLVDDAGKMTLQLQQNTSAIYDAAKLMNNVDNNFSQIATTLDSSITTLDKSATFVEKLNNTIPNLKEFSQNAEELLDHAKNETIPALKNALPVIKSTVDSALSLLSNASGDLNTLATKLQDLLKQLEQNPDSSAIKAQIATVLQKMAQNSDAITSMSGNLGKVLQNTQDSYNNTAAQVGTGSRSDLTGIINKLAENKNSSAILTTLLNNLSKDVNTMSTADLIAQLQKVIDQTSALQNGITQLLQLNVIEKANTFLDNFATLLTSAANSLHSINTELLPDVPALLGSVGTTIKELSTYLKTVQADMPVIKSTFHSTNTLLQNNVGTVVNGINSLAGIYQNDYPALRLKLTRLTMLVQDDLQRIESELTSAITLANEKMPEIKSGLNLATEFIKNDWPDLKAGIKKGAAAINKVDESVDMDQLIDLLKRDANKEANFLASPVELKTNTIYPIPTYGSQSTPFYTALCIWVGALLLSSVVSTDVFLDTKQKKKYSSKQQFFGRYLTFLSVGLIQALIVSLGNMFLIHTYVQSPVWFVITTMFIAFSFFSILYSLVALFGNIGKGLGIIILVLSISGAGGNFPVILSGQFFRSINPFLPFTYAINGLRETVGGIYWPNFQTDWIFLAIVAVVFLVVCSALLPKINPIINKIHNNAKKSMIIH